MSGENLDFKKTSELLGKKVRTVTQTAEVLIRNRLEDKRAWIVGCDDHSFALIYSKDGEPIRWTEQHLKHCVDTARKRFIHLQRLQRKAYDLGLIKENPYPPNTERNSGTKQS